MWYKLSKDEKERHIRVMRIYLLSPFLFGQVYQEDKVRDYCEICLTQGKVSFQA